MRTIFDRDINKKKRKEEKKNSKTNLYMDFLN